MRLRTRRDGDRAILEVQDNGIGMTEEVRRQCTQTHFSTKRDNALYEGYNAGGYGDYGGNASILCGRLQRNGSAE